MSCLAKNATWQNRSSAASTRTGISTTFAPSYLKLGNFFSENGMYRIILLNYRIEVNRTWKAFAVGKSVPVI